MKAEQVFSNKELDKFKLALDHAPVSVFIMDKNWNFEYINPEFEKLSGFTSDELLNKNIGETLYKNVQGIPESRREIITHLNEGISWKGELLTVNKNGSTYWAETTASPYKNEKGEVDGFIVIQNDVTESRRMQEALQRSERRFRELTEMLPQAIYELDANNHPLFMNRAGLKMFGLFPGAASQSKKAFKFFSPGDTQKMKEALDRESKNIRYENGVLQPFASEPTEYMANKTDGSTFPVIIYGTPIIEEGKVTGSRGIIIDISERKIMEDALRESEKKYKTLVENSLDGIIIVRNNQILFMNDTFCNMLGYSCEMIYNSPSTHFIHPDDRDRVLAFAEQRKQGDFSTINDRLRLLRADGTILDCEVFSSLIEYEGLPAVFFTIHNVTENRRMQKALEEKEELYRTLIEKTQDGVVLTQNRKFYLVNQAFCDIFGYTREVIMNMNPIDLLAPEKREQVLMMHDKRMRGEIEDSLSYVATFIHKSGKRIIVEMNSSTVKIEGQNLSFVTLRDVTESNRIQEALRESEKKYRELTELLPQTVYEHDLNGKITYLNKAGKLKFEIESLELEISAFSLVLPGELERMRINMQDNLSESYSSRANIYTAVKTNGEQFPVMIFAAPMISDGKQIGTRGIILDMTEYVTMEKALRESEKKYRELADFMPQTIFELDNQLCLVYMNKKGMETFGLTEANYGESCLDSFVGEDKNKVDQNLNLTMEGKRSKPMAEYVAKSRTGRVFPVLIYTVPVYNGGEVSGTRGMVVDISERKDAEQALRESEEKYRMLINNANDGIIITQNGVFKFANSAMCDILQYSFDELAEQSFYQFVIEEDHHEMAEYHQRRMSGEYFNILYRAHLIRKDREIITVELNSRTLTYNNHPAAFIIVRDITERVMIENELKVAKKELEMLNHNLEARVKESSNSLTEARTQLIRLQKENLQSQFEVLRQQVNPHFLFNSLNVLTSLIKLEPDLAEKFTEHLAKVYRYVLENKDNDLVDLNTELDFLDAYMFLLNIRFMDKIKMEVNISLDTHQHYILPLALQLIIENAIKHNTMSKKMPLHIKIFADEQQMLNVTNNLQERESHMISTGVGLKNITHRYKLLEMPEPEFYKTETHFVASIPLKKRE